jgi:heme/copper-type cytochrome/quinol oxidase subunit 2
MQKALAGCFRRRGLERGPTFRASPLVSAMSSQVSDVFDIAIYIYIHIAILCTSPLVSFLFSSRKRKKEKNKNEKKEKNYTPLLWCVVSFLFLVC